MERVWSVVTHGRVVAPMLPLALAALAGSIWSVSQGWAGALLLIALILGRPTWKWWLAAVVLMVVVGWRFHRVDGPVSESLSRPRSEYVVGVLEVGRMAGSSESTRLGTLDDGARKRRVMVLQGEEFRAGDRIRIRGRLVVPERERNPGVFPQLDWWQQQGVQGGLLVSDSDLISVRWSLLPLRWAEQLRAVLDHGITRGLGPESNGWKVIRAMVLGDKPSRDSEVSRAFRDSGAMHVFAVSGLHVTLVGLIFWLFLRPFPIQRRTGLMVVMISMLLYAMVTGLRPPAVRATIMAACFFGAFFFRRRPSLFNALALSLILVVLWNPVQVHQAGFQLSYGVLLAIGLGVGLALRITGKIAELDPFFPSRLLSDGQRRVLMVRTYFANLGASSLAAWLGSMPIMIWHFGIVTPIAVITSLVLIPATMLILSLAFLGAILGGLSPLLGSGINQINSQVAEGSFLMAKGFSKIPFGHWRSKDPMPADWVVFDCGDGGAASLLRAGQGVIIEAGSEFFYKSQLKSILDQWNAAPDLAFVSHPDGGHAGGLPSLLERGALKTAVLPVKQALSPTFREFRNRAGDFGCETIFGERGKIFNPDDGVWVEILTVGAMEGRGIADNRMMVMKVHWHGWKVLVTGDLGMRGELTLLEEGADLSADVVWMGRHEWGVSGQHQFLKASGARVVITSSASLPAFERPPERWVSHLDSEGIALFHQGETGAVMMDFDEKKLRITSYLQPEREVVLQR